jgi:hypothetical protein
VNHPEFSGDTFLGEIRLAIEDPDYLVSGWEGALMALRWSDVAPHGPKHLCVVYRELNGEGFVITAFFVTRYERLLKRGVAWQRTS